MRLKSIKLAGFKSFVDPTTVHFPSNMCGVVGPNGCGKSNIIDAVRWVMGESSAKHLRGESMTDVIFKGSNSRKPASQASVELIFDNNEGRITGEFAAYREISVKRVVYSDAKNIYYLNGNKCRRRDIMDIFLGTGLGPRSYAIISQGIISNLIESKPEELRVFIEEAAGISRYKERRRETENRIRRTNENLERLTDLREELERQLGHLHRQAQSAEKYKEFKAEERLKKAQLQALRWQSIHSGALSQEQTIREFEVQLEAANSEHQAIDTGMEQDRFEQIELSDHYHASQTRFYGTGNEVTRIEETLRHRETRAKELNHDLEQVEQSWEEAREQLEADQLQLEAIQEELLELEPELELLQDQQQDSSEALQNAEEKVQQWQREWDQFNQRAHEPKKIAEVEQSRIQHAEQVLSRLQERKKRLAEEMESLGGSDEQEALSELNEQLTELELTSDTIELRIEDNAESITEQREAIQQHRTTLEKQRESLSNLKGRYASLEVLHQAAQQTDEPTETWLKQQQLGDHKRLMDTLTVSNGWEQAVETALGDHLTSVCVSDISAFSSALATLEQGHLTLLELHAAESYQRHNDLPLLSSKLINSSHADALLHGIYAAESLTQALAVRPQLHDGESIITSEGIWLSNCWLRINRGDEEIGGILARQQEMAALSIEIETLSSASDATKTQLQKTQQQLEQLEALRTELQKQLAANQHKQGTIRTEISTKQVRLEQFSERRRRIEHDFSDMQQQVQLEQEVIGESRLRLQDALDHMEQDIELRETLLEKREQLQNNLESVRHKAQFDKDRAHQLALRQQSINAQILSLNAAIERLTQQATKLRERRAFLQESIHRGSTPEQDLPLQLETLLERRLAEEQTMQAAKMALDEVELRLREAEKSRHSIEQKAQKLREQLEKLRLDWQSMQVRRTTLAEQLAADQFDLQTVVDNLPADASEIAWEEELNRIAARIERLGAINLAAIDEYESQSERKRYLDAQNDDLVSALNTLENAIRKIDKETRHRFKMTFDKVNAGLQELFPRVFGGGNAYLALTGDDLLDTGVAIMAQPPGKKNSTIHLLSGGEKALTAIALVFAIFQLNPSPFCMLDEVDAPLDDANVGRYAKMVAEMSSKVQFVYITHNKIAMQAANQLIGVTMHEPGVSRPVSVDIEQAAALAEM